MLEPKDITRYERELRAMLIRASDEDPEGFAAIVELVEAAAAALPLAAQGLKRRDYPWREIASAMRTWTSSVHRKYGQWWAQAIRNGDCVYCRSGHRHICLEPNHIPDAIRDAIVSTHR